MSTIRHLADSIPTRKRTFAEEIADLRKTNEWVERNRLRFPYMGKMLPVSDLSRGDRDAILRIFVHGSDADREKLLLMANQSGGNSALSMAGTAELAPGEQPPDKPVEKAEIELARRQIALRALKACRGSAKKQDLDSFRVSVATAIAICRSSGCMALDVQDAMSTLQTALDEDTERRKYKMHSLLSTKVIDGLAWTSARDNSAEAGAERLVTKLDAAFSKGAEFLDSEVGVGGIRQPIMLLDSSLSPTVTRWLAANRCPTERIGTYLYLKRAFMLGIDEDVIRALPGNHDHVKVSRETIGLIFEYLHNDPNYGGVIRHYASMGLHPAAVPKRHEGKFYVPLMPSGRFGGGSVIGRWDWPKKT